MLSMMEPRSVSYSRERPTWQELARRFEDGRECLATFLALETAEVVEGTKPANLLNIVNRDRACGRNLYNLWKRHGQQLLNTSGLASIELASRSDSILVMIYHPGRLHDLLSRKSVATILRKAGYPEPESVGKALEELACRVAGSSFPHEIGVFLGYPLKDVIGFMGWAPLPFTCQGPWKIYGDPTNSLRLAESFRHSRCRMAALLSSCADPSEYLKIKAA